MFTERRQLRKNVDPYVSKMIFVGLLHEPTFVQSYHVKASHSQSFSYRRVKVITLK